MNEERCKGCLGLDMTDEERKVHCEGCIEADDCNEGVKEEPDENEQSEPDQATARLELYELLKVGLEEAQRGETHSMSDVFADLRERVRNGIEANEYCVEIEIKPEITGDDLKELRNVITAAFRNRAGSVIDSGDGDHELIFAGCEADYGCLQLGSLALAEIPGFAEKVLFCRWLDPEPGESCNLIDIFRKPVF